VLGFALYVLFVAVAYMAVRDLSRMQSVRPAAMLAASTAVLAWVARPRRIS